MNIKTSKVNIQEYIESGVLEAFVHAAASEAETKQVLYYKDLFDNMRCLYRE